MSRSIQTLLAVALLAFLPAPLFAQDKQAKSPPAPAAKPETAWARRVFTNPTGADIRMLRDVVSAIAAEHAGILGFQPRDVDIPAEHPGFGHVQPSDIDVVVDVDAREGINEDPPSQFQITVHAHQPEVKKRRALELLDAISEGLRQRLQERMVEQLGIERSQRAIDETERSLEQSRDRLEQYESLIRQKTGRVDASLEPIRAAVPKFEEQRQALKLEVIGKQARQQALAEAIERLAKAAEKRATTDPVAAELEKVVKAREAVLERTKKLNDAALAAEAEVAAAEVHIAEARAKLLERRETVAQTNGGDLLSGLNRELATLSIDVAEAEAKLASLEKTLAQYGSVQDELSEAEEARRDLDRLNKEADDVKAGWRMTQRNMPASVLETVRTDTMAPDDPRLKHEKEADEEAPEDIGVSPAKP